MAMNGTQIGVLAVVTTILLLLLQKLARIGQRPNDLPPGPPTIPVLGNIHLVSLPLT